MKIEVVVNGDVVGRADGGEGVLSVLLTALVDDERPAGSGALSVFAKRAQGTFGLIATDEVVQPGDRIELRVLEPEDPET